MFIHSIMEQKNATEIQLPSNHKQLLLFSNFVDKILISYVEISQLSLSNHIHYSEGGSTCKLYNSSYSLVVNDDTAHPFYSITTHYNQTDEKKIALLLIKMWHLKWHEDMKLESLQFFFKVWLTSHLLKWKRQGLHCNQPPGAILMFWFHICLSAIFVHSVWFPL